MARARKKGQRGGGRPIEHGLRALERRLQSGRLDGRSRTAKLLAAVRRELMDDAGGPECTTNREAALIDRSAVLVVLLEALESHVLRRGSPLTPDGQLLPFLRHSYLTFVNTLRRNLVALQLRPDGAERSINLQDYLREHETEADPAPAAGDAAAEDAEEPEAAS